MENIQVITQSTVNVHITSNVTSFCAEKRFPKNITVGELKVLKSMIKKKRRWTTMPLFQ